MFVTTNVLIPTGAGNIEIEPELIALPPSGEYQPLVQPINGFVVPVNVAGLPAGQIIFCTIGVTVEVGAVVLIPIAKIENELQPVTASVAVTVYCAGLQNVTFVPLAVPLKLIHVYVKAPNV